MIFERVAGEARMAPQIAAHPGLRPETVKPQRDDGQQQINRGQADERSHLPFELEILTRG
jgi:hypothetical protein